MKLNSIRLAFVFLILSGCFKSKENAHLMDKDILNQLKYGIVEIVVPKLVDEELVEYESDLPFDSLPFKERNDEYFSIGTAFFVTEKKLLSAAHVFQLHTTSRFKNFYIRDFEGKVHEIDKVTKYSMYRDLIEFDIKTFPSKIHVLKPEKKAEFGQTIFSIGNALGEGISFRSGQIASFTPEEFEGAWKDIRFSSPASPGNSGGPLVNGEGEFVGIIVKKTANENLNFAIPTTEYLNLSSSQGELYSFEIGLSDKDVPKASSVEKWKDAVKIPLKLSEFRNQAQAKYQERLTSIATAHYKKYKEILFPLNEELQSYLRSQVNIIGLSMISSYDKGKTWEPERTRFKETSIDSGRKVQWSQSPENSIYAVVEKPKSVSLKSYLEDPKLVMNDFIEGVPMSRRVGQHDIRITQFKQPVEVTQWEDFYGRNWIKSTWSYPGFDWMISLNCIPHPVGAACVFQSYPSASSIFNSSVEKYNMNQLVAGYEATVEQWNEYFQLDQKLLPSNLKEFKFKFQNGKLEVDSPYLKFQSKGIKITKDSEFHLHFGISPEKKMKEVLTMVELFPKKGEEEIYFNIYNNFKPLDSDSSEKKVEWEKMASKKGKFNGSPVVDRGTLVVRKIIPMDRKVASASVENLFLAKCSNLSGSNKKTLGKSCDTFIKNIHLK